MDENSVVIAEKADIERMIIPVILAFSADPFVRWLFPDPERFLNIFRLLARTHAEKGIEHKSAFRTKDFRGAALWYPPNVYPDSAALAAVFGNAFDDNLTMKISSIFSQMQAYKPTEPHWYLRQIGIDPALHGKGYGSALINEVLRECDRTNIPAYLEASTPRNRTLYERLGFKVTGEIRETDSPPIWPMLREASK
jgi:GNAT superfamily N-acetyltransferase